MSVPTVRPRHAITETADVERALKLAARRWPEDRHRSQRLLRHLIDLGASRLEEEQRSLQGNRMDVLRRAQVELADCYPEGYLAELREDWPA